MNPLVSAPPLYALSVRQPWAWLIVQGYKTFENRDWSPNSPPRQFVKNQQAFRCLIHASSTLTKAEYAQCEGIVADVNRLRVRDGLEQIQLPAFDQLARGGIVGSVEIHYFCNRAEPGNPWSFGPGLMLENPESMPFTPCRGSLGFFKPLFA
jgi:hypothetical protein